jgi:hypothetical protein
VTLLLLFAVDRTSGLSVRALTVAPASATGAVFGATASVFAAEFTGVCAAGSGVTCVESRRTGAGLERVASPPPTDKPPSATAPTAASAHRVAGRSIFVVGVASESDLRCHCRLVGAAETVGPSLIESTTVCSSPNE